jgi:hypothetical protein
MALPVSSEAGIGDFMRRRILVQLAAVGVLVTVVTGHVFAGGPPATIAPWTGTPQNTTAGTNFQVTLVAVVRDSSTSGVPGVTVTFTAPSSGPSATFGGSLTASVVTDNNGAAIAPTLTANLQGGSYTVTASVPGVSAVASFTLTNTGGGSGPPGAPSNLRIVAGAASGPPSVSATGGTPQSAVVNAVFGAALQATVRDSANNPLPGVQVTFTAPAGGASALFGGATTAIASTNASGVATSPIPSANGTPGSYVVTASAPGAASPGSFSLTNSSVPTGGSGWTNVTPGNANVTDSLDCDNKGSITVVSDPLRPSNIYAHFYCQGVWRSTDYGQTWTGPLNTGTGGQGARGAGGIAIAPGPPGQPPILYASGFRGTGMGFWKSVDGGVSWTNSFIAPGGSRQDFYTPIVDPTNPNHVIMNGHEMNLIVRSVDGGQTWTSIPLAPGMNQSGGTGVLTFVKTGTAATTATTWLWSAQAAGGAIGTWRTTNAGASWTKVDNNEHPHGGTQTYYQPDTSGVIYMAGVYSAHGWGVLRSTDYGQTWAHVGGGQSQASIFGSPNRVYSFWSWACGRCTENPNGQSAPAPGITGWAQMPTPAGMTMGPTAGAVVFDGQRYVVITANWLAGLWRYVE